MRVILAKLMTKDLVASRLLSIALLDTRTKITDAMSKVLLGIPTEMLLRHLQSLGCMMHAPCSLR